MDINLHFLCKKYHRNFNGNEKERNCQALLELLQDDSAHSSIWISAHSLLQKATLSDTYLLHIFTLAEILFLLWREGIGILTAWLNAQQSWQPAWRDGYRSHIHLKTLLSKFSICQWCWLARRKDYTTPMNCPYVLIIKRKIF